MVDVDFISSFWRNARTATAMQGKIECVAPHSHAPAENSPRGRRLQATPEITL